MTPSDQEICGVVVVRRLVQEGQESVPTKTTADARAIESDVRMRHTKLTVPRFRQGIDPPLPEHSFMPLKSQSLTNGFSG